MFLNPVQVESIDIKSATFLTANEAKTHHHQSCQCHATCYLRAVTKEYISLYQLRRLFPVCMYNCSVCCLLYAAV